MDDQDRGDELLNDALTLARDCSRAVGDGRLRNLPPRHPPRPALVPTPLHPRHPTADPHPQPGRTPMAKKSAPHLPTGDHLVDVTCPICGEVETISVTLEPWVSGTRGSVNLRVKLSQEKADHDCHQLALTPPGGDGDDQADLFAEPELDPAE